MKLFKAFILKRIFTLFAFLSPVILFANIENKNNDRANGKNPQITPEPSGWNTEELITEFKKLNSGVKEYLKTVYKDNQFAETVTKNAFKEYKALVIELPDVGGKLNPDSKFLNIAAWYLTYYRAMKPFGKTAEDVGRMIYQLNKIEWKHYPEIKAKTRCHAFFSKNGIQKLKQWCKWTQQKQYPANWTAKFVSGDGKDFDFGYDYSHCGVCMYLYAHNAIELAPFVCTNDFLKSEKLNTGLHRTKTIAMGDGVCNFRFKKGRKVTQNWDTEIKKIREHIKKGKLYKP